MSNSSFATLNRPHPPLQRVRQLASREGTQLSTASLGDLDELLELERSSFTSDRISRRSWRQLIRSRSATVIIARGVASNTMLGAAVLLKRSNSSVSRLYSIATSASHRGQGLGDLLLDQAEQRMRESGGALLRLETRADNLAAQRLFKRHGFMPFGRVTSYYEDGADAIKFQKSLWDGGRAANDVALRAPFYAQTLDFTCGPCSLLMAMAALDESTVLDRAAEIRLWREATTVFMAAGHGGCGPFGLALAAVQRGFKVSVYAPAGHTLFVDSVRDQRKKDVIALVEADFRASLAATKAQVMQTPLSPQRLAQHLHQGGVPLVLISLWRLHGEKGPHWVVVTGFDGQVFRILDPIAAVAPGSDPGISVSVNEFKRMARYGRRRQAAAVIISKGS